MKQINETMTFLETKIKEMTGGHPAAVIESVETHVGVLAKYNGKEVSVSTNDKFVEGEVVPVIAEADDGSIEVGKALEFKQSEFVKALIITRNFIATL